MRRILPWNRPDAPVTLGGGWKRIGGAGVAPFVRAIGALNAPT
jgi:hypothetical protein